VSPFLAGLVSQATGRKVDRRNHPDPPRRNWPLKTRGPTGQAKREHAAEVASTVGNR